MFYCLLQPAIESQIKDHLWTYRSRGWRFQFSKLSLPFLGSHWVCWGAFGKILGCLWVNKHLTSWHMEVFFYGFSVDSYIYIYIFFFCLVWLFFLGPGVVSRAKGTRSFEVNQYMSIQMSLYISRERTYMSLSICKLVMLTRCLRSITETYDSYIYILIVYDISHRLISCATIRVKKWNQPFDIY